MTTQSATRSNTIGTSNAATRPTPVIGDQVRELVDAMPIVILARAIAAALK